MVCLSFRYGSKKMFTLDTSMIVSFPVIEGMLGNGHLCWIVGFPLICIVREGKPKIMTAFSPCSKTFPICKMLLFFEKRLRLK